jgi:hypothetical protein
LFDNFDPTTHGRPKLFGDDSLREVQPYLEGEGTNCLNEHYIWRAIEQASRIADKIDKRWPVADTR